MLSVDEQMRIITSGAAQIVPEADLRKKLEKGEPLNIKLGVDPTSPDLHLGHAVPLRKMRQFQDLGHNVTLIIGNGTALIGDPSGKNSTRPQLSQEQIEANAETYVSQAMKILDPEKTTIVHNGDWLKPLDLSKFIAQLLFIGHALIDAAATNILVSADFSDFHIFHLKSPVAVIKFFLVFQEPIFLDGFTNTSHGVDKKMQIVCRHQHG